MEPKGPGTPPMPPPHEIAGLIKGLLTFGNFPEWSFLRSKPLEICAIRRPWPLTILLSGGISAGGEGGPPTLQKQREKMGAVSKGSFDAD